MRKIKSFAKQERQLKIGASQRLPALNAKAIEIMKEPLLRPKASEPTEIGDAGQKRRRGQREASAMSKANERRWPRREARKGPETRRQLVREPPGWRNTEPGLGAAAGVPLGQGARGGREGGGAEASCLALQLIHWGENAHAYKQVASLGGGVK